VALLGIMGALMGAVVTASCLLGRFGLDAATHSVMIDASQSDFAKNSRPTSSTWQPRSFSSAAVSHHVDRALYSGPTLHVYRRADTDF
jgi:hypothetical protein